MMKNTLVKVIWFLVLVVMIADFGLYVRKRAAISLQCDVNKLNVTGTPYPPALVKGAIGGQDKPQTATEEQEFCEPEVPCVYPDEVDFRLIVMTHNRASSVEKLLKSLDDLELDGDKAALEIFIDRDSKGNVHQPTLDAAQNHQWPLGKKRVHVWARHVGIYGQWIDSWRPKEGSQELSLILEDDLTVSKYSYRWIKAAHKAYGNRADISGYTLQSDNLNSARGGKGLSGPKEDSAFLYRVLGSWGFAPNPKVWRGFQDWFHEIYKNKTFHPYVDGIVMTSWYKSFEHSHHEKSMWTMWFIWYTNKHNLFCVINNLRKMTGSTTTALAVHRHEPGLHYHGKGTDNIKTLLTSWHEKYVEFPANLVKLDYDAKVIK